MLFGLEGYLFLILMFKFMLCDDVCNVVVLFMFVGECLFNYFVIFDECWGDSVILVFLSLVLVMFGVFCVMVFVVSLIFVKVIGNFFNVGIG